MITDKNPSSPSGAQGSPLRTTVVGSSGSAQPSSALQYAMRDRLIRLGWSEIEVIDDDLGRSAAGSVQRAGFERMVAQVCLGKVGAVAARDVSRFARNSWDWQQLIEMCRVVDTVLIDQETIYAPIRSPKSVPSQSSWSLIIGLAGPLLARTQTPMPRRRKRRERFRKVVDLMLV
jgi:hypothetical protein